MDLDETPAPGPGGGDSTPSATEAGKSRSGRVRSVPNFAAMAAGTSERGESTPSRVKQTRTPTKASRQREAGADGEGGIGSCPRTPVGAGGKGDPKEWSSPLKGSPAGGKLEGRASEGGSARGRKGKAGEKVVKGGRGRGAEAEGADEDEDEEEEDEDEDEGEEEGAGRAGRFSGLMRAREAEWGASGGLMLEGNDIDPDTQMPFWVKDSEFLTEPLEGHKAYYILHNRDKFRAHFLDRDPDTALFATYDRHPPDTALDPQSGVVYFIRTEEGLQDKAITLKSVASGPTKHTWKMAWGRKTHLKKWGILYKSYRCRQMWQPRNSPPPYRMQIYVLEHHDPDLSRGEAPAPGHVLVQILSLQDAPLRRRSGMKREAEDGGEEEGRESVDCTPSSLASSRLPHSSPRPSLPSSSHRSPHHPRPSPAPDPLRLDMGQAWAQRGAARGSARRRLHSNDSFSPGPDRDRGRDREALAEREPQVHHRASHHPNPLDSVSRLARASPPRSRVVRAAIRCHALAAASLPAQASMLQDQYGGLGTAVLAGMVSGQPWGLSGLPSEGSSADSMLGCGADVVCSPDYTAFGWAELIYLHAAREAALGEEQRLRQHAATGRDTLEVLEEEEEQTQQRKEEGAVRGLKRLWAAAESHTASVEEAARAESRRGRSEQSAELAEEEGKRAEQAEEGAGGVAVRVQEGEGRSEVEV